MKMCQSHWDKIKAALTERDLMKYVGSAEQAVKEMLAGEPDPLMAAHNSIVSNALSRVGLDLMMPNADGSPRCPICYLVELSNTIDCTCGNPECTKETRAAEFERWIEYATNEQLERFTKWSA